MDSVVMLEGKISISKSPLMMVVIQANEAQTLGYFYVCIAQRSFVYGCPSLYKRRWSSGHDW